MDGTEVIRTIRSRSNMPIIVVSARIGNMDKIDALDAGDLIKPFSGEELLTRLRVTQRRLNRMPGEFESSSLFKNGQLKIDYSAGCAWFAGEELHLTPIKYKLLCLLSKM